MVVTFALDAVLGALVARADQLENRFCAGCDRENVVVGGWVRTYLITWRKIGRHRIEEGGELDAHIDHRRWAGRNRFHRHLCFGTGGVSSRPLQIQGCAGKSGLTIYGVLYTFIGAGFYEEFSFRGFLMGGLATFFGGNRGDMDLRLYCARAVRGSACYQNPLGIAITAHSGF